MNASRSALTSSFWVVQLPCEPPLQTFSLAFLTIMEDSNREVWALKRKDPRANALMSSTEWFNRLFSCSLKPSVLVPRLQWSQALTWTRIGKNPDPNGVMY